jgi:hypothetical protein
MECKALAAFGRPDRLDLGSAVPDRRKDRLSFHNVSWIPPGFIASGIQIISGMDIRKDRLSFHGFRRLWSVGIDTATTSLHLLTRLESGSEGSVVARERRQMRLVVPGWQDFAPCIPSTSPTAPSGQSGRAHAAWRCCHQTR